MDAHRIVFFTALWVALMVTLSGNASEANSHTAVWVGDPVAVGKGTMQVYVERTPEGHPKVLGVRFSENALHGLPQHPSTTGRCFDVNRNGTLDAHECLGDYEWHLVLPQEFMQRATLPFQWVGVNWNPAGHIPPAPPVWAVPHFDFHFYLMPLEAVQRIRPGSCGEMIDCADFTRATTPVPTPYLPPHHINVDAAVPMMGNHLIDTTTPELGKPPQPFTHTFIYGAYDGHISFYEPMITRAFLLSQPQLCKALHLPAAWETSGYYPEVYCIRYHKGRKEYTVSLERFVYRSAP